MPLPCKMGPTGDLLEFPHKDHLVAYYYQGKFDLMPGRQLSESYSSTNTQCVWLSSGTYSTASLWFADSTSQCGIVFSPTGPNIVSYTTYQRVNVTWRNGDICFGNGRFNYNFNTGIIGSVGGSVAPTIKRQQAATNVKFGCCFDINLTKAQMDDVAKWILSRKP